MKTGIKVVKVLNLPNCNRFWSWVSELSLSRHLTRFLSKFRVAQSRKINPFLSHPKSLARSQLTQSSWVKSRLNQKLYQWIKMSINLNQSLKKRARSKQSLHQRRDKKVAPKRHQAKTKEPHRSKNETAKLLRRLPRSKKRPNRIRRLKQIPKTRSKSRRCQSIQLRSNLRRTSYLLTHPLRTNNPRSLKRKAREEY